MVNRSHSAPPSSDGRFAPWDSVGDGLEEVGKFRRRPGWSDLRKVNSCLRFDAAEYIRGSTNVRIHCRVWPRWRVSWTGVLGHRCEESPAFHPRTPPALRQTTAFHRLPAHLFIASMYSSLSSAMHHIFFRHGLKVIILQQDPNCLASCPGGN